MFIQYIKDNRPDIIINACGYTGRPNVDACEDDKADCWDLNVNLPVNISTICKLYSIPFIHVSSGCIYTGYDKEYTEEDEPNFGIGSDDSSWYSKTKHACETILDIKRTYILRVRMPFCADNRDRSILSKVLNYNNLINMDNSMTCVEDFTIFISKFIEKIDSTGMSGGIFNVCNPGRINLKQITDIFKYNGIGNKLWNFVDIKDLELKANRSNCVLDCTKISKLNLNLPEVGISMEKCISKLSKILLKRDD
jgi:dTDP-4-dehydrorhamnose reductase|tara:strand:+ start:8944 stop:9699 length:756 start_codon:yes stop_codon:yes gene_type:complete